MGSFNDKFCTEVLTVIQFLMCLFFLFFFFIYGFALVQIHDFTTGGRI